MRYLFFALLLMFAGQTYADSIVGCHNINRLGNTNFDASAWIVSPQDVLDGCPGRIFYFTNTENKVVEQLVGINKRSDRPCTYGVTTCSTLPTD